MKWLSSPLILFNIYIQCMFFPLSSVLRSFRQLRVHAEILKHHLHIALRTGVHPQDYCLRSTGELSRPYAALLCANTSQLFTVVFLFTQMKEHLSLDMQNSLKNQAEGDCINCAHTLHLIKTS